MSVRTFASMVNIKLELASIEIEYSKWLKRWKTLRTAETDHKILHILCSALENGRFCIDTSLSEAWMDKHIWSRSSNLELGSFNAEEISIDVFKHIFSLCSMLIRRFNVCFWKWLLVWLLSIEKWLDFNMMFCLMKKGYISWFFY